MKSDNSKQSPAGDARLTPPRDAHAAASIYGGLTKWARRIRGRLNISDHFQFDDQRRGRGTLVCMLTGSKPELWPYVMPRFKAALPESDICLVSPGLRSQCLADLCGREGWSYLSTATRDASLAQNVCYRLHDGAELIVKLDEDMFLLPDSISALVEQYRVIKADGVVDPGFVAPTIPLNGFCYRHFLDAMGLLDEYEARFGRARIAASGLPIHGDPSAACWIWERTAPLEEAAARMASNRRLTLLCPIQFSTGMIVFEREFWEMIGRYPVLRRRLVFGISTEDADEAHLCASAVNASRPGVVTTAAVAAHFAFAPQYAAMRSLLRARPELFEAPPPPGRKERVAVSRPRSGGFNGKAHHR